MTSTTPHSLRQFFAPSGRPAGDTGSEHLPNHSPVWIVMGVSGSGKSRIGSMLAERFELPFLDADDVHPESNIKKMASGVSLTDRDREPWLERLSKRLEQGSRAEGIVLACSALKETYRKTLASQLDRPPIWIWLDGEKPLIRVRLQTRDGHFMPDTLLDSQFRDLEPPEEALRVDITLSPTEILDYLENHLRLRPVRRSRESGETYSEVGLIGLGVMGRNLALNMADYGIPLALFNRVEPDGSRPLLHFLEEIGGTLIPGQKPEKTADQKRSRASDHKARSAEPTDDTDFSAPRKDSRRVWGCEELDTLVRHLNRPRTLLLMVPAGDAVDEVLRELQPLLDAGDLVIDGGNSHFESSERRGEALRRSGIHFVGMGISGGAKGARHGPALMPGGSTGAWSRFAPIAEAVAASTDDGSPCCRWMGPGGAGHFVKMVHNGIEYAEMELFAEIAWLLERVGKFSFSQIADTFEQWNQSVQGGFLTELTARIYRKPDRDGKPLLDRVRDRAGQKGTGNWCVKAALELGVSTPIIAGAVQARVYSSHPARTTVPEIAHEEDSVKTTGRSLSSLFVTRQLEEALLGARLLAYAEGMQLIQAASTTHGWSTPLRDVLQNWRAGSILRSGLLTPLKGILPTDTPNTHPLQWPGLLERIQMAAPALRLSAQLALEHHLPTPALSAALTTLDTLASPTLPTRLIQAQRDGFGHHTFERTDRPAGEWFHSDWTSESPDPDEDIGP